ncbi:U4/U6.U5 small nuclear ribonucleoprotein 27 kDa protein [Asparagus officinalis]|uniref:U4/U6.U5 small nuclear ribonucleoprotein 27 kDa protein n=1 Tax=Asparagus officinalis TaxID=4686 RepID=UPI00098DE331|nr:U4/U6.U5 small nuclear ribonucleoprotein 27 kDa protein [Asparagus officinalis]
MSDRRREKLRDRDHRDRDRDRERDRERDRSIARAQSRDRDRDRRPRPAPRKRSAHRPRQHRSAHQKKLPPRRGVHRRHSHRRSHPTPPHRRKRPREESEEAKESREEGVPRVREAKDDGKLLGMAAGATDVDAKRWQMMKMLGIPLGFDSTKGAGCLMPILLLHPPRPQPTRARRKRRREESEEAKESKKKQGVPTDGAKAKDDGETVGDGAEPTDVDANEMEMMKMLGIPLGFDSTKGKPVPDANVSGVRVVTKRQPRQYMNRRGGFNRPLPPERNR